jgi:hypothetical protein
MAKQNGVATLAKNTSEGESSVSLLSSYKSRTKLLNSGFLPNWEPSTPGEEVLGVYTGNELVKKSAKVEKEFLSYKFDLVQWTKGIKFTRQDAIIPANVGMGFAISGKVIDEAMTKVEPGMKVILTFNGFGAKKKGRNPAKLIEVHTLS